MIPSIIVPVTYHEIINAIKTIAIDDGSQISSFKEKISEYIDCSEILLTYSGRTALYLLLKAYGLKKNDEVIMPAYDCETVARLIIDMGYNLRFVDVDKNTYNMSVEDLGEMITNNTKAVIAIHMFGNPCDMDGIMEVASDHDAVVIEDSAQTIGAEYNCKKTGTVGDCGFFSFGTAKPMTTMNGGLLIAKNEKVMGRVRMIARGFRSGDCRRLRVAAKLAAYSVIKNPMIYDPIYKLILNRRITRRCTLEKEEINPDDFSYTYTDMQAAVGMMQLSKLDVMNNDRIANANHLMKSLNGMKTIHLPEVLENAESIFLRLPIWIEGVSVQMRDELIQKMQKSGIDTPVAYPNVLPRFFNSSMKRYPNTEELVRKTITLPVHPLVKDIDIERMVCVIEGFVGNHP
ncbi:MAG: UDP-4-amino-4-deoxy-L-arabinose--oxoglutarate aminotransferase [Candidatus Methanogaster sp.]|nr:MAG: UDP-4-amino-4-deoxy-L-arabinose--oxoglutarate aminotransferase [ANME-2 cluster archaeon]